MEILAKGINGISEARSTLDSSASSSPLYGLMHFRNKKIFLKFVPETSSRVLQRKCSICERERIGIDVSISVRLKAQFPSILTALAPYDANFSFTKPSELSEGRNRASNMRCTSSC